MTIKTVETENEGLNRAFMLTIPAEDIEARVEQEVKRIAPQIRMPGFRPGKVPANLIRKMLSQYSGMCAFSLLHYLIMVRRKGSSYVGEGRGGARNGLGGLCLVAGCVAPDGRARGGDDECQARADGVEPADGDHCPDSLILMSN